jgi:hypothetical protein
MALSNITFVKGSGGLGRPLAGQDHFSALIFYASALPSGFSSNARIKKFLSLADAEAAGIRLDYADETKAAGSYEVTGIGANGDTVNIKVTEPYGAVIDLGTYTKAAGQTTVTAVAAAIVAIINAGTSTHGYTASNTAGVITITARPGLGIFLNSGTPITVATVGTIAGTLTQFTAGAFSRTAIYHYHISEFFRLQPKGVLYVGIFAVPGSYTFSEIDTIQSFADGTIRRVGIYKDSSAFATGDMTLIQGVLLAQEALHKPLVAIYAANIAAVTDISTLTDLNTFSNYEVSPCISQDGAAVGALLYLTTGKSITTLGAYLGASAFAKVNESVAWVQKFNISNGVECEVLAFANGQLFSAAAITDNLLNMLDQYRYVFLRKFIGQSGSYFNGANSACSLSNDYAYLEDNLTIQKAMRGVYSSLLPALSGPLQLNADGTLSDNTIAYLESLATPNLDQMVRDSEISAYGVRIDTAQNVLTTGKIIISVQIVQQGVARQIEVPIGYTTSLS